jgi:hypothetical protein
MTVTLHPPLASFSSEGGRTFTVEAGLHSERWEGDPLWNDAWPIRLDGNKAGKLFRNLNYGVTAEGLPRWHASTRELYWSKAGDAPTGIGFDVSAFDTPELALAAWARSADQILDWSEGKPVPSLYSKTGFFQKKP